MKYILLIFILLTTVGSAYAWDNNDRDYRKEITVSHINVSGSDLINYPAFLNITKDSDMQSDYDDLIFYDASGNLMAAELEKGYTDYALVWINISTLSISGTSFWMYYGNDICSDSWNAEGVWNSGYAMVQHLNESPANGVTGHIDSTNNDNDGTPEGFDGIPGSTTDTEGIIDGADVFSGTNDYVDCGTDPSLNFGTGSFSTSFWFKTPDTGVGGRFIIQKETVVGGTTPGYNVFITGGGNLRGVVCDGVNEVDIYAPLAYDDDAWYHGSVVWESSSGILRIYVDGVDVRNSMNAAVGNIDSTFSTKIGGTSTQCFNGLIDEVRISNIARSFDWIKQDYEMVINQTTMATFGDEEVSNKFLQGASYFHIEMVDGLTDFRDSMGKYLVWGIVFFAVGLSFALFTKIKETLIGGK